MEKQHSEICEIRRQSLMRRKRTADFKKAAEWKDNIAKLAKNVKKGIDAKINSAKKPDGGTT
jgi:hypothetical protein